MISRWTKIRAAETLALLALFAAFPLYAENRIAPRPAQGPQPLAGGRTLADAVPINAAAVLSKTYEEKAREVLERYVPQREFQVNATVTPNGKPIPRAPYEPRSYTPGASLNMEPEELEGYVSHISLEVLLSSRLQGSKHRIEDLLMKSLKLKRGRDRISFDALGLEIDSDEWRKEKTDMKREIEVLKNENNRLNQELANKDSKGDGGSKGSDSGLSRLMKTEWFLPALVGGVMALLLLAFFILARGMFTAGRSMGTAITAVAASLERVGGAINTASGGGGEPGSPLQKLEAKFSTENGKQGLANLPMESIMAHMMKLRNEILETLSDGSESIILRHLTQLVAKPESVARAVCTLELLGRDTATEMFRRLGVKSQEAIMVFLRGGVYDKSKIEMMLEAGEELKTKLLVESFERIRGKPSEKVAQRMIQLSDEEIAQVACDLETEYMPRLFLYLDPPKIAKTIASIKRLNPEKYQQVLAILPKMPEAITNDSHDDNITVAMDNIIDRTRADFQRPFLKIYQDIVESSEEEVSEQLVRELSSDPRIDEYFRQNVITVHTFFLLPDEQRNEMLESLSNKDIAAFATGCKPDEQQVIFAGVPQRRKEMVNEEFESLTSRGGRQAQYAYKRVHETIVKRLREMKAEGTLVTKAEPAKAVGSGAKASGGAPPPPPPTRGMKELKEDTNASAAAKEPPAPPKEPGAPKLGNGPEVLGAEPKRVVKKGGSGTGGKKAA